MCLLLCAVGVTMYLLLTVCIGVTMYLLLTVYSWCDHVFIVDCAVGVTICLLLTVSSQKNLNYPSLGSST